MNKPRRRFECEPAGYGGSVKRLGALALLVVLVAGCSSSRDSARDVQVPKSHRHATRKPRHDIAWLALLRRWRMDLARNGDRASRIALEVRRGTRPLRALKRPLSRLTDCRQRLRDEVGQPNARRYGQSYAAYFEACDGVSRWALALKDAAVGEKPGSTNQLSAREARIETLFEQADMALQSSLLAYKDLPTIGGRASRSRIEPRLGRAVSQLAYKSPHAAVTEVRCWSKREWPMVKLEWRALSGGRQDPAAFAYDLYRVSVAPRYCADLVRLVYEHRRPTRGVALVKTAAAVGVLAHETGHLYEYLLNEARTECYAVQHARALARILGASPSYAELLAETNWRYVYPYLSAAYRTRACRNGGRLDEHPRSDVWP